MYECEQAVIVFLDLCYYFCWADYVYFSWFVCPSICLSLSICMCVGLFKKVVDGFCEIFGSVGLGRRNSGLDFGVIQIWIHIVFFTLFNRIYISFSEFCLSLVDRYILTPVFGARKLLWSALVEICTLWVLCILLNFCTFIQCVCMLVVSLN